MFWNTLNSYGDNQGAFLDEGCTPTTTESSYKKHCVGGSNNVKETATTENTVDIISGNKNQKN